MPIYEYKCPSCGHAFERMVRVGAAVPACPSCGAPEVRKLVSASSFVLKGGGWYRDHYGLKSGGGGESKAGESKAGESKAGGDGGGSAPAAAPAAGGGGSEGASKAPAGSSGGGA